jgi:hypothetical protein
MEDTSQDAEKGKRPTRASTSSWETKAVENPPKKQTHKQSTQFKVVEPEHHESEHAQAKHDEHEAMEEGRFAGDDLLYDI